MITGGPFAPISYQRTEQMLRLLDIKMGDLTADLGAGDGRLVIAMAKKGATAHGYEINPLLVIIARFKIRKEGLREKAFIHLQNMWKVDYSNFDKITVYLSPHIMRKLEIKLKNELKKGAIIAMNHYHFPNWNLYKTKGNIYLYRK